MNFKDIFSFRKALHSIPEFSLEEVETRKAIVGKLNTYSNLEVHDMGLFIYAVYHGADKRPPVAFRADFDAVMGKNGRPGHYCGHDGHTAALVAFAEYVNETKPERTVYFLFQPAEETGAGAKLCTEFIKENNIGEIYGIHNIPGYKEGTVILIQNTFACASCGLELTFKGAQSHAAYPEEGKNPALIIADVIRFVSEVSNRESEGLLLVTVIGCEIGSNSYGVSAGEGVLRLTVRGENPEEFESLLSEIKEYAESLADKNGIECSVRELEKFPATVNYNSNISVTEECAIRVGADYIYRKEPFRWSEDFGHYLNICKGAFIGIGAGEKCPGLHTDDYEFPDEIIKPIVELYSELVK